MLTIEECEAENSARRALEARLGLPASTDEWTSADVEKLMLAILIENRPIIMFPCRLDGPATVHPDLEKILDNSSVGKE